MPTPPSGPWQRATLAGSTLTSPMLATDTSCQVASIATFPASAPFAVVGLIPGPAGTMPVAGDIMWVTENPSGTTLSGLVRAAEGPNAATAYPAGTAIICVETAATMGALVQPAVTSVAGLSALIDSTMQDGQLAFNSQPLFRAQWRLSKTSTATVNNLTVAATLSGTGRWELLSRHLGMVPVTEVGADPSGVADSSTAFSALQTALSGTGVAILVPSGTYQITAAPTSTANVAMWSYWGTGVTWTGSNATAFSTRVLFLGQAPGTAAYNPGWYAATAIYIDPQNSTGLASDSNAGTSSTTPLLTMAQVIQRYGATNPQLPTGQTTTIYQMSAQTQGVDDFWFSPRVSGGANFQWIGQMPTVGATFSPTSVTAKVKSATGNDLQITVSTGLPAGVVVGNVIYNTTKESYGVVIAVSGDTATITQPCTSASVTGITLFPNIVQDNTWAATDVLQAYKPLLCNWRSVVAEGGDYNSGATQGTFWIQGVSIANSGSPYSHFPAQAKGLNITFSLCTFEAFPYLDGIDEGLNILSCLFVGGAALINDVTVQAGGCIGNNFIVYGSQNNLDGGFIENCTYGADYGGGTNYWGEVHFASAPIMNGGTILIVTNVTYPTPAVVWGAVVMNPQQGMGIFNTTGQTWANTLLVTTLELDGSNTGWTSPATGTFTLNGTTQVDVTGVSGTNAFPANAPIGWALKTVGSTPGTGAPYFSQAQASDNFYVKSPTANANDVYAWTAGAGTDTLSSANLDKYQGGMRNPRTGSCFAIN